MCKRTFCSFTRCFVLMVAVTLAGETQSLAQGDQSQTVTPVAYALRPAAVDHKSAVTFKIEDDQGRAVEVTVLSPAKPAAGKPWVWQAYFTNMKYNFSKEMLDRGYHVVQVPTGHLGAKFKYTSRQVHDLFDKAYARVTADLGLASKAIFEARSRGGLPAFTWAAKNTDKVAGIYANNAVSDIKSWPGGFGVTKQNDKIWKVVKRVYELDSDEAATAWKGNPVDVIGEVAKARIPVVFAYSPNDMIVPPAENALLIQKNYDAARPADGPNIKLINVGDKGHNHKTNAAQTEAIITFLLKANRSQSE